jgi:dTDP-4-dehydrorhamnose reductase
MKKTIMIFGISSFVGSNILEFLREDYRIIGTYHKTPVAVPGVTCVACDVLKKEFVTSLVGRFRPDVTVYAVGLSSLRECHNLAKQADALNSAGAVNCCVASERYGSKFVYLSSCFVLAGEDVLYREGETPFPKTVYGHTLSSTEFYVQRSCLNYLILRCAPLYGRGYNPTHHTWFEHLQASLAKGEPVLADGSVHTGFLDVQIMARVLKALLETGVTNRLFHVSSRDFLTRYDFARSYAGIFRRDAGLVQRVSGHFPVDKNKTAEGTTFHFRLDSANLEEFLGTKMPTIEESLALTYRRLGQLSGTSS